MSHKSDKTVPDVPTGGNTNPPLNPAKRWVFTLNNHTEMDMDIMCQHIGSVDSLIWQEEISATGTKHLQGAIVFTTKLRPLTKFAKLLGHKRTHWELMKGTLQDQYTYCHKDESRLPDGKRLKLNWPRPIEKIEIKDLRPEQKEIAVQYTEDEDGKYGRKIRWYWEMEGGWGKSILAKYMVDQMGAMVVSGACGDCLFTIATYIQANGDAPPIIIFDIPRCNEGHVSYQAIEQIKNGLFCSSKYESKMVRFNSPHVIVFSNQQPDMTRLSKDRWVVQELEFIN